MSYSVQYCPELNKKYPKKRKIQGNQKKWIAVAMICLTLLLTGRSVIRHTEFGERAQERRQRIGTMLEQIRGGTTVSDALTTYCLGVLKDAQVY